jgi:hypothetical protein
VVFYFIFLCSFIVKLICLYISEFEWMLSQTGAVKTTLKDNPRQKTRDVLFDNLRTSM